MGEDVIPPGTRAPVVGLSSAEVAERVATGLTNAVSHSTSRSLWDILRANIFTLFNAIVVGSFALLLVLGQWRDALFGVSAVSNSIIGVVQEFRAKRTLDRLAVLGAPKARVLRDAAEHEIAIADVVRDDVLVLRAGDQVPADALLLDVEGLEVDESLLTGEAEPVHKAPGDGVLSGSSVVAGQGWARATHVGAESFAARLTMEARRFSLVSSEIRSGLNRMLRWISWGILPIMAIVVNGQMQSQGGWAAAIESGEWRPAVVGSVASIIAMVPLGLVLMASVAFAVSGLRLARNKVLIQELAAVEGLARVDMLCLDKTGTLTEGTISFDAVHLTTAVPQKGWRHALGWFGADPNANATARSLATEFKDGAELGRVVSVPFSSKRKWSSVSVDGHDGLKGTWVLGAPEIVLEPGRPGVDAALAEVARLSGAGNRTLVLAYDWALMPDQDPDTAVLPPALVPMLLLTFSETVRSDAARTLAYFREQGVGLRIISGDDPRTVAAVARSVGLELGDGFDARLLPADPDAMATAMEENTIFGRVTPEQKRDMVRALQRRGHVVAMTGDGANDALALKEADIGIAMNTAAPATKALSQLVLLDGRFDRLPGVIGEGRRVIANFERLSMLFLTKTTYAVAISVAFGTLLWSFPFLPRQLSVTDGLTIGLPAFYLALMPNTTRYRPGFVRRALSFAVPAGIIVTLAMLAIGGYVARSGGYSVDEARTASVVTLSLIVLWVLMVVSRPLNLLRVAIIGSMYIGLGMLLTIPWLTEFFELQWPPDGLAVVSLGLAAAGCVAVEVLYRVHTRRFAVQP